MGGDPVGRLHSFLVLRSAMRGNSRSRSRRLAMRQSTVRRTVCALCAVVVSSGLALGTATLNPVRSWATPEASIGLQKLADVAGYSSAGTPITYSYLVTNTGRVTLTSVGVTDGMPGLSAVSCPTSTLAVAANETCTATYTTTQADVDAGKLKNTGVATGTPPTGPKVTASSSLTIPASQERVDRDREVGRHHRLLDSGHLRRLQLPGDQPWQRDAPFRRGDRPHARAVGGQLPDNDSGPGC